MIKFNIDFKTLHFFYDYDPKTMEFQRMPLWKNCFFVSLSQINFFFYLNYESKIKLESFLIFNNENFIKNIEKDLKNERDDILPSLTNFDNNEAFFKDFKKPTFISFFLENSIDVPICFKKSPSLKTRNFELMLLKFCNITMKDGLHEKTWRNILKGYFILFDDQREEIFKSKIFSVNWIDLYVVFSSLIKQPRDSYFQFLDFEEDAHLQFGHFIIEREKELNSINFVKNHIIFLLTQLSPIFTYYIYNVDKNIRKFTRGKAGKYVFIWKYIAPYKRRYSMFRWFINETRFDDNLVFKKRFKNLFNNLTFNINNTYAVKAQKYAYAFIFKNFRKSLMTHLKTISK